MSTSLPPGILEALQIAPGTAPDGRTFQEVLLDLTLAHASDDGVLTNKYDLLCPRGCRSVILKRGVGQLVERSGIEMDSPGHPVDPALDPLPAPPATVQWWLVTPSPMTFENIGFSRSVVRTGDNTASPKPMKFLICADCDVGPLGWCEEGGKEFWLACSRVKYAVPLSD
ncbi:Mss4-like protein [Boletus reticuloceps]|uniref:Mss4-like protein n=1 Tax=Boletus reticuloceps TaxID=495285 RepID=A0A8I2YJ51_9AGAM|nr:Mss4-like protein [Boletus reticuloceps]